MEPLSLLPHDAARALAGVIFDLDDTVLDHGALTEAAYGALFRLRETGLTLIACTGRPAGWGEVILRQWPLDAAIAENGAVALVREAATPVAGAGHRGGPPPSAGADRIVALGGLDRDTRRARRAELVELAEAMVRRFPAAALADDNDQRVTDVTIDIGEHRRVPSDDVARMRAELRDRGVRTLLSSVHLHLTRDPSDKATGVVRLLSARFGEDPTRARYRYAFVGDSGNDGVAFAAFAWTFGVSNVRAHLGKLSVPPRFVASHPMGRGFAEIARRIAALRGNGVEP
ncbi:haloacid dehalogenase [Sorangium cellulosum]|uniref:Haloacid dehalogenase n=1 Tax=Sorangium cellulosum TaxID=56 RepID=A0A2L0EH70_SORCE|nr:HAD hydrolase family protein [Sorangium cellulosum]AUX38646.1 haloacid dehalogenase [Sorangium cellulosum]